jgi:hypothetical protein
MRFLSKFQRYVNNDNKMCRERIGRTFIVLLFVFVGLAWSQTRVVSPSLHERVNDDVFKQIRHLLLASRCSKAYLDIGSNIGVQIRKLYEPSKYAGKDPLMRELARKFDLLEEPTAKEKRAGVVKGQAFWNTTSPVLPIFDDFFGKASRCQVCAIGVEPNPKHTSRLLELQRALRKAGAPVLWLVERAVGISNGFASLDLSTGGGMEVNDVGLSVIPPRGSQWSWRNSVKRLKGNIHEVITIDLAELVQVVHEALKENIAFFSAADLDRSKPTILMKLDIEGGEYELIPHLLSRKALCPLDLIFLEWHNTETRGGEQNELLKLMEDSLSEKTCSPVVSAVDDETFLYDGKPFPDSDIC